jgi:hypothetical protein
VAEAELAAVGARFWSDEYPHLYNPSIQTDGDRYTPVLGR